MTSTMRQEFVAGRLAAADYVVHLEREIDRLQDALIVAHERAWNILEDMKAVQRLMKRGAHPAGSATGGPTLHIVERGDA